MTDPLAPDVAVIVYVFKVNVAVHVLLLFIVTEPSVQSASPDQPENTEPRLAVAPRATTVPWLYVPAPVTVPVPVPAVLRVRIYDDGGGRTDVVITPIFP